jgi:PEP-CTERM motif
MHTNRHLSVLLLRLFAVLLFSLGLAGQASAYVQYVYATYAGSQQGVTVRDANLIQQSLFGTGIDATGITVGPNNDLFISAANQLRHYTHGGALLNTMTFPNPAIVYTDVAFGGTVMASYNDNASLQGVTIRDLNLNQLLFFNVGLDINGIAAGAGGDLFLAAENHLLHYQNNGTLIFDMAFPDAGIVYTDITYHDGKVYASYTGSSVGVTVRDINLNQNFFFGTSFTATGIAAGDNNDMYLTSGNHIYHYADNGTLIQDMEFTGDPNVVYTDVAVKMVPEPGTLLLMAAGLALAGLRRKQARASA